jgi:F-type H+-transporting ATPase subunit b
MFTFVRGLLIGFLLFSFSFGGSSVFASDEKGASGEHAAHDPTHGNATNMLSHPLEWRSDQALFTLVVFGVLVAVLYGLAWKPLIQGLDLREKTIAAQIAEAKQASELAAAKLKEYEVKLQEAAVQAQALVAQARKDAESVGERIKSEAQAEAARQRDRSLAEIESAKQAALSELTNKSTDMAFALARRVVGRELRPEDHQQLINDAMNRLPSQN